jgi:hypothetical protein
LQENADIETNRLIIDLKKTDHQLKESNYELRDQKSWGAKCDDESSTDREELIEIKKVKK